MNGPQLKDVQSDLFRLYPQLLLSDRIPGRTVNGLDDVTIEIADAGGQVARLVLDPQTGLPARVLYESARNPDPPIAMQDVFSDYREVAGIRIPFRVTTLQGGEKFADAEVKEYRVNLGLKPQELEKRP